MIVVTGGAGFIGSALVWDLNQNGFFDILVVDDFGKGPKWKNLNKRRFLDVMSPGAFLDFLAQPEAQEIQVVFHMGACSSTTETNVDFLLDNNYIYTRMLNDWCATNNKRLIYASSGATYGNGEKGFDDNTSSYELSPLNPYGYSKVLFDRWLESDPSSGAVGLKFFNVFGPQEYHKEDMASVVFKAFNQIQQTGTLKLFKSHRPDFKDGEQLRDFVYVKDITRWMIEVMNKPEIEGVFNMGFGKARSWLDLGNAVFAAMGKTPKYDWIEVPENIRNQYQYFTEAKMDKWLQADMSAPQWNLEKAVTDYVQNYLMKPDQYL